MLAPYSLRIMVIRYHDALLFTFLLLAAAIVYALGGVVLSGTVAVLYVSDPLLLLLSLLPLFLFSLAFVRYASGISEYLGHRTYITSEEFLKRSLKCFVLMVVLLFLATLSIVYIPYLGPLVAFFFSLLALIAGTIIAIDGARFFVSLRLALSILVGKAPSVAEFVVLSFLLLLPLVVLDVYGGWVGSLLSLALLVFLVVPWLASELALVYLTRYPLVESVLSKSERF